MQVPVCFFFKDCILLFLTFNTSGISFNILCVGILGLWILWFYLLSQVKPWRKDFWVLYDHYLQFWPLPTVYQGNFTFLLSLAMHTSVSSCFHWLSVLQMYAIWNSYWIFYISYLTYCFPYFIILAWLFLSNDFTVSLPLICIKWCIHVTNPNAHITVLDVTLFGVSSSCWIWLFTTTTLLFCSLIQQTQKFLVEEKDFSDARNVCFYYF